MIKFPCHCSHIFALEDDMAGSLIQCPRCGRLNDVPMLNDLEHIANDGTFKLDDSKLPVKQDPDERVEELDLSFSRLRGKQEEIDLRPTLEDVAKAGQISDEQERARRPKYDPITGELIRPVEVAKERPAAHPVPFAKPALGYAPDLATQGMGAGLILLELFNPVNLLVQAIIVVLMLAGQFLVLGLSCLLSAVAMWVQLAYVPFVPLIMAHYGNVIDDTGREARDELPRPFRDLSWPDDLWGPFYRMALGLIICYWPAALLASAAINHGWSIGSAIPPAALLGAIGTIFLPAVWLTCLSSGTIANLRPDRVVRMIGVCLPGYLLTATALVGALVAHALYLAQMMGYPLIPAAVVKAHPWLTYLKNDTIGFGSLFVGVYLMHFVCWHLGSLYNRYNERFPWVLQRHTPSFDRQRLPATLPATAPRRRGPPPRRAEA